MLNKINIPGTTITMEITGKEIDVKNQIDYDIVMAFKNQDAEPSLDENGDIFEPLYWLSVAATPQKPIEFHSSLGVKAEKRKENELQKFFEYIEANKQNLFDLCGLRGELQ
jgi:hypothetical protein|nr:MAG TPA: hypothetical protein [Caudoviricetes sp.]